MDHFLWSVSGYDNLGHPISGVGREAGNELHARHRRLHHGGDQSLPADLPCSKRKL